MLLDKLHNFTAGNVIRGFSIRTQLFRDNHSGAELEHQRSLVVYSFFGLPSRCDTSADTFPLYSCFLCSLERPSTNGLIALFVATYYYFGMKSKSALACHCMSLSHIAYILKRKKIRLDPLINQTVTFFEKVSDNSGLCCARGFRSKYVVSFTIFTA